MTVFKFRTPDSSVQSFVFTELHGNLDYGYLANANSSINTSFNYPLPNPTYSREVWKFEQCQSEFDGRWVFSEPLYNLTENTLLRTEIVGSSIVYNFYFGDEGRTDCAGYVETEPAIEGVIDTNFDDVALAASGTVSSAAFIDVTLGNLEPSITGNLKPLPEGVVTSTLPELIADIDGAVTINGIIAAQTPQLISNVTAYNANLGVMSSSFNEMSAHAIGEFIKVEGLISVNIGELNPNIDGFINHAHGYLVGSFNELSLNAEGSNGLYGQVVASMPEQVSTIAAGNPVHASLNVSITEPLVEITANHFENQGAMSATFGELESFGLIRGTFYKSSISEPLYSRNCLVNYDSVGLSTTSDSDGVEAEDLRFAAPVHTNTGLTLGINCCVSASAMINLNLNTCTTSYDAVNVIGRTCTKSSDVQTVPALSIKTLANHTTTISVSACAVNTQIITLPDSKICVLNSDGELVTSVNCLPSTEVSSNLNKRVCHHSDDAEELPYGANPWITPEIVDPPIDPPPTDPPSGETINIPERTYYTMEHSALVQLEDDTEIEVNSVNVNLDAEQHSWTFSGTLLHKADRKLILPSSDGTPVIIKITINGYLWKVLVERVTTSRSFNSDSVNFSGRGITALLSEPYQTVSSVAHGSLMSNQQIAESMLPFGWVLNWNIAIFNVPANTYSYTNQSPLQALQTLVKDCGGVLVPHRYNQEFTVIKRYPVLPWNFDLVSPDVIVPDSVIFNLTEAPDSKYGANGVYVHGVGSEGKQALVRRTGTAGEKLATTTSNQMMVDSVAIRALGERILAGEHEQPTINEIGTWMTDLVGDVPLFEIGSFAQFNITGEDATKGIVSGVTVSCTLDNDTMIVSQELTIGENTNNLFNMFKLVQDIEPTQVATIISVTGNTSLVQFVTNNTARVSGVGVVGNKYYVRNNEIKNEAPDFNVLPDVVI